MTDDEFEAELATAFASAYGVDDDLAAEAAEKVAAFRADFDVELTTEAVLAELAESPYEAFEHRFDAAVGELAASVEDCTDSREYRIAGYDDLSADPSIGA
jgi:hypothetical protein